MEISTSKQKQIDLSNLRKSVIDKLNHLHESKSFEKIHADINNVIKTENIEHFIIGDPSWIGKLTRNNDQSIGKKKDIVWYASFNNILQKLIERSEDSDKSLFDFLTPHELKQQDGLKIRFLTDLHSNLLKEISSLSPEDFFNKISKILNVRKDELKQFLVSNPVLIFDLINKKWKPLEEKAKKNKNVSEVYFYSSEIGIGIESDYQKLHKTDNEGTQSNTTAFSSAKKESKKYIFTGHALSPHSDSICLLYDLGRLKRISDVFSSDSLIYLTAPSWAKCNRTAIDLIKNENNRKEVLMDCLIYREKLYNKLKIIVDTTEDHDITVKTNQNIINNVTIHNLAKEYAEYSNLFYKMPLEEDRIHEHLVEILTKLYYHGYNIKVPAELKTLNYSITGDKRHIFVILSILRHFNILDEDTFYYTFLQRFKQQQFPDSIKLAVESEEKFDSAFIQLDKVEGFTSTRFSAVYYKHYYFKKGLDNLPLNVIPYTFPSGSVWTNSGKNIDKAIENVILLWDFKEERKQKITKLINEIELDQLAIQMSDLFSFCNYFFDEEFWTGRTDIYGHNIPGLNKYLKELDPYCDIAWANYRKNPSLINKFSEYFLTMWTVDIDLPYYFYPFLHVRIATGDPVFESKVRATYSDIIIHTLTHLNKQMSLSEWK